MSIHFGREESCVLHLDGEDFEIMAPEFHLVARENSPIHLEFKAELDLSNSSDVNFYLRSRDDELLIRVGWNTQFGWH